VSVHEHEMPFQVLTTASWYSVTASHIDL